MFSTNSAVFFWKSVDLIGSPIVYYSLTEHNCVLLLIFAKKYKKVYVMDYNPLEFLLKQLDYLPLFSMSDRQRSCISYTIPS